MQYSVYEFQTRDEIERAWLISILTDYGFDGFEEASESLMAYVPVNAVKEVTVYEALYDNDLKHVRFSVKPLEDKNWNEEWEKNFEPVLIAGRVAIRAPFHEPMKADFEIIIEPKMSFGTGHHATTASVVEQMLKENFDGKAVLDFGSGTGVLAILAEKLKANSVVAIDNEEWAYNNCVENVERNNCVCIKTIKGDDTLAINEKFEFILANINRNVIIRNIANWKKLLHSGGTMIVSGILQSDEKDIVTEAAKCALTVKNTIRNNGWLAIAFVD